MKTLIILTSLLFLTNVNSETPKDYADSWAQLEFKAESRKLAESKKLKKLEIQNSLELDLYIHRQKYPTTEIWKKHEKAATLEFELGDLKLERHKEGTDIVLGAALIYTGLSVHKTNKMKLELLKNKMHTNTVKQVVYSNHGDIKKWGSTTLKHERMRSKMNYRATGKVILPVILAGLFYETVDSTIDFVKNEKKIVDLIKCNPGLRKQASPLDEVSLATDSILSTISFVSSNN